MSFKIRFEDPTPQQEADKEACELWEQEEYERWWNSMTPEEQAEQELASAHDEAEMRRELQPIFAAIETIQKRTWLREAFPFLVDDDGVHCLK